MTSTIRHPEEDLIKWKVTQLFKKNNLCIRPRITVSNLFTMDFELFYNTNNTLYDTITDEEAYNFEKIEEFQDESMHNKYSIQESFTPAEFPDIFEDLFEPIITQKIINNPNTNNSITFDSIYEDLTYINLPIEEKEIVDDWESELTYWTDIASENELCESLYGVSPQEIEESTNIMDALSYWTTYFEPNIDNADAAFESNLTPFKYDGQFYIALDGCGMDLSPRLDTYQALTTNTIPSNSKLFTQRNYFENVVGKELTQKIINLCARHRPWVSIEFEYTKIKE